MKYVSDFMRAAKSIGIIIANSSPLNLYLSMVKDPTPEEIKYVQEMIDRHDLR